MANSNTIIQVFAKAPIEGFCKTRLAKDIGDKQATAYHARMAEDTLSGLMGNHDVQLWCKPSKEHSFFQEMKTKYPVSTFDQKGESLGIIMDNAAHMAFKDNTTTIIQMGTDCPQLDQNYIEQALEALDKADIVIGPADDGGYVLLAQQKHYDDLYKDIEWGSSVVLEQLTGNIKAMGLSYTLLNTLRDVDTAEDLQQVQFL